MTSAHPPNTLHAAAPDQIPTMSREMALPDVSEAVHSALNARLVEKQALWALSEDLRQSLQPEIERLTADLVQRTLQAVWDQRCRMDPDA